MQPAISLRALTSVLPFAMAGLAAVAPSAVAPSAFAPLAVASGSQPCRAETTPLDGNVCLDLRQTPRTSAYHALLQSEVARTLATIAPSLPVRDVRIIVVDNAAGAIPEIGLGGYTPSGSEVRLFVDPARADLADVIRRELLPLLAHELHHAMRWRAVGYGTTLREAAVSEGLADHFALEVSGSPPPPWTHALDDAALARWVPRVAEAGSGFYNHSLWFFGTTDTIPRWTGYAVGFELVRRYQAKAPGRSAASLVGEPAAQFVP
jgi:hypothetical protein